MNDPDDRGPIFASPSVDYRFTLANERTYLAWLRTALAVLAGAVLLNQHATSLGSARHHLAGLFCLSGGLLAVTALVRWRRNQIAIARGAELPDSRIAMTITTGVVAVVCIYGAMLVHR